MSERLITAKMVGFPVKHYGESGRGVMFVREPKAPRQVIGFVGTNCILTNEDTATCSVAPVRENEHLLEKGHKVNTELFPDIILGINSPACLSCPHGGTRKAGFRECPIFDNSLPLPNEVDKKKGCLPSVLVRLIKK